MKQRGKVWTLGERYRGTLFFPGLLCLVLNHLLFHSQSFVAWGLFLLWVLRIVCTRSKEIIQLCFIIGLCTILFTLVDMTTNQTKLDASLRDADLLIYPSTLSFDGDRVTGEAITVGEKIRFSYTFPSKNEKDIWENLDQPFLIEAVVTLEKPNVARNFYQFDYRNYLQSKRIHWVVTLEKVDHLGPSIEWKHRIKGFPFQIIRELEERLPSSKTKNYLLAMVFNRAKEVEEATMDAYQKVGVIHLFSISGMHIQAILVAVRCCLIRIGVTKETTNRMLLFSIIMYGMLIGSGVGIFRAILTNSILLLGVIHRKSIYPLDALSVTAMLALWMNPYLLSLPAFQLSYALALGLCFFARKVESTILLSLLLTALTIPILSFHFFEVSWIGFFFNLMIGTLFSIILFPIFWLLSIFAFLGFPTTFYDFIVHWVDSLLTFIEQITQILANWKMGILVTGRMNTFWYIVIFIGLFVLLRTIDQKNNPKWAILLFLTVLCGAYLMPLYPNQTVVTVLDIGQGDAILVQHNHAALLLDTGGTIPFEKEEAWQQRATPTNRGERLIKSLKALGVKQIDTLVLTHRDYDHLGNLADVLTEIKITKIVTSEGVSKSQAFQDQLQQVLTIPVQLVRKGDTLPFADLAFHVLYPEKSQDGSNNDSLVLTCMINGSRWLFMGDLEEEGERELLIDYPHLQTDYLKVGHHGSKTSTSEDLLTQLKPQTALISAGVNNRYGHPHGEIVKRLEKQRIQTYRTDQNGAIQFRFFKGDIVEQHMIQ